MRRNIAIKTHTEVESMRGAGLVVAAIHAALWEECRAGVTPRELDRVSARVIAEYGATSNFLGYHGYPATACISVNDQVVHAIPGDTPVRDGDLVSFDCGAYLVEGGRQWHADAAFTLIVGGEERGSEADRQLNATTEEAMWTAIAALATGRRISRVGEAVERVVAERAERHGWEAGIVEEFTGHGIGNFMHEAPDIPNFRARGLSPRLKTGMVVCVEPILTARPTSTRTLGDGWTTLTADGAHAAHWEHTVAILEDGISVLTAPDWGAAGLAPHGVRPIEAGGAP